MIALRLSIVAGMLAWLAMGRLPDIPLCGFHWLTGLPCPLCGMTRGLAALLHGEWRQAIALHALSPLVLTWLAALIGFDFVRLVRPSFSLPDRLTQRLPSVAAAMLLIYGIARWPLH